MECPFFLLGLPHTASPGCVTRAWKKKIIHCHPDKVGPSGEEISKRLNDAKDRALHICAQRPEDPREQERRQQEEKELQRRTKEEADRRQRKKDEEEQRRKDEQRKKDEDEQRTKDERADERQRLEELAQAMRDASICGLGQTASSAIQSAIRTLRIHEKEVAR